MHQWHGTTIAFDGVVLASDTAITAGNYTRHDALRKIHPVEVDDKRYIFALAGVVAHFEPFIRWYLSGASFTMHRELFAPHIERNEGYIAWAIVCDPKNRIPPQVEEYNSSMPFRVMVRTPCAIGAGQEIAHANLLKGADPVTAVELASLVDRSTGGTVEAFDVHDWKWINQSRRVANLRQLRQVSTERYSNGEDA